MAVRLMVRPVKTLLALSVLLLLAACSSSSSPPTVASIASKAGCANFQPDTSFVLFVRESGECTVAGSQVTISTFNDASARDSFLKIAKTFGGTYGHGGLWVISGQSSAAVTKATTAAGGVAG